MKKLPILISFIWLWQANAWGMEYPVKSKTLANGLKIIVCEKNTNTMAEIQVWYKVGSKDEWDGIRGMAHLFEHMMFRGSRNFSGDRKPFKVLNRIGGMINAYTTFDRTVYHEEVESKYMELMIEMEADRMENLILDQTILDTEREVVGEELRLDENNWHSRLEAERYRHLYPEGHPYKVDVIGNLNEITGFTTQQCQDFYDKFYSPNNAFVVVTGNVKAEEIFSYCEKHFGKIKKQLPLNTKKPAPDIFSHKIEIEEMPVDFLVQIYSYVIPSPPFGHKDYHAFNLLSELLFSNPNSLLNKRLVNNNLAYQIMGNHMPDRLYAAYTVFDIVMRASVGNAKVKKLVAKEINEIISEGIGEDELKNYLSFLETENTFNNYSNSAIGTSLGAAEYYFNDYGKCNNQLEEYKKITAEELQDVAKTYFNPDHLKVINIMPTEVE